VSRASFTRSLIVGALAVVGLLGPAATASAAVSCTYYPPPTALIDVILSSDDAIRLAVVQNQIQVQDGSGTPIACSGGPAPTATTATIDITDGSGGGIGVAPSLVTIDDPARLARTAINLDLRAGDDAVELRSVAVSLDLRFGATGVNTNPADLEGSSPDADITSGGVDLFEAHGSSVRDRIRASGAVPGDTFTTVPLEVNARGGGDLLAGGDVAPDELNGGPGEDTVTYGAALESVLGKINGQIYENNTVTGRDTLTGIEILIGSSQGDTLTGDGGRNTVKGGRGADSIHGKGNRDRIVGGRGRDELFGDAGIDSLFAIDRTRDAVIDCGNGLNRKELARTDRSDPAPRSC
jgi:Ca2+-binding RTX toxin-like protein